MENYNTASELLTQMLDGELDQAGQDYLFNELAIDKELQNEMQSMLSIRESVRNDVEAFTPPADLTKSVFASLGYVAPNSGTSASLIKKPSVLLKFAKRASIPVALLLIAFTGFMITNKSDNSNITDSGKKINSTSIIKQINETIPAQSKISEKRENGIARISSSVDGNKKSSNAVIIRNEENENIQNNQNVIADAQNLISEESNIQTNNNIEILNSEINQNSPQFAKSNSNFRLLNKSFYSESKNYTVFIKGINGLSNMNLDNSPLSNMVIGALMPIKNDFSAGLAFGKQNYMRFKTNSQNLISDIQESQSVTWITPFIRYDANAFEFAQIHPFAEFGIGGSTLGFLLRGNIGVDWQPNFMNFGVSVAYDYSKNWYSLTPENAEKVNFVTNGSGLVVGISYKF